VILLAASELSRWCESHAQEALPTLLITTAPPPREMPAGINWHSVSTDTSQFAREMYALFRRADRESCQRIVVELPSAEGIGLALRDRLQRAAN
jgi:L-threonylcarbamoyladenylate synthase